MKKPAKVAFALLTFVLAVIGIALIVRYAAFQKDDDPYKTFALPRLVVAEVRIGSITRERTEMVTKMLVKNPLPIGWTADSIGYEMYISDVKVAESTYPERFSVAKGDSTWITLPVIVYNEQLTAVLNRSEAKGLDSAEYEINSTIYTKLRDFEVNISRVLPLVRIPEIKMERVEADTLRFSHAHLLLHISVTNKNVFPIKARDIRYRFSFGGKSWFTGSKPGLMSIPAQSTAEVVFPLKISFKGINKGLFRLLNEGGDVPYRMVTEFRLVSEKNMLRDSKIIVENEGTAKTLVRTVREKRK